jgi:hypothetical protein
MSEKKNDKEIRTEFIERNKQYFKQENCLLINEFGINGKNIVDLAFFDFNNNLSIGFEIKGEGDNTRRLEKQLITYTSYFNIVYVISYKNHVKKVKELLDSKSYGKHVGVIEVDSNLNFNEIKKAYKKKPFFDTFIRNLDKEELMSLCESKGFNKYGSKSKLIERLKMSIEYDDLFLSLKRKLVKFYYKRCKCGSSLYFNKTENRLLRSFCYDCGSEIS